MVTSTRQQVIDAVWGGSLPRAAPDQVTGTEQVYGLNGKTSSDRVNVAKCLRFKLPGDLWSRVQVSWPKKQPRNMALIYCSGHESDPIHNTRTLYPALDAGLIVAETYMLLYHSDEAPYANQHAPATYYFPDGSTLPVAVHNDMAAVAASGGHPIRVHLDPIFRTVGYLRSQGIKRIGITGVSGGGWRSLMAAALDAEIDFVASMHGWCPFGAIGEPARDYEQTAPILYSDRGMGYEDYSAMVGVRRQLITTGDVDPVFGPAKLGGQSVIDTMVAGIQARGANLSQQTFAGDHSVAAAEVAWILAEFTALGCPYYEAPMWIGALQTAIDLVRIVNALAGYPARGTDAVTYVNTGPGEGRVYLSTQDYARLYDSSQVATLSLGDQTIVTTERGSFTSR